MIGLILAAAVASPPPLARLSEELLSHDSATAVLQGICDRRAPGTRIRARQAATATDATQEADARLVLRAGPSEPLRHRRVELMCGEAIYSRADNWYLSARLTPQMNETLDTTETPFGVAVKPLDFHRTTLQVSFSIQRDGDTLEHRATLSTPDGRPFSYVVERYDGDLAEEP